MTQTETEPQIYKAIAACMREIDAIGKGRKNTQQGYSFRGIDDVYNELHDVLAKHGVFTVPFVMEDRTEERTTKGGTALIYRVLKMHFTFYAPDGSNVSACVMGEGMDSGDKASNKAMAVAHKYALMQVFCIPTEDAKDPENDSHEVRPKVEVYEGKPHQKQTLKSIFDGLGVDDGEMVRIASVALGTPMHKLRAFVEGQVNAGNK